MAELVEGTYAIISVKSSKAVDVCGASDKSGANVIQWNHTNGDAQIWSLRKGTVEDIDIDGDSETESVQLWQIMCSLSGKVLATADDSPKRKTNVCQKDDKDTINSQRWIIQDLSTTTKYKDVSYEVYSIRPAGNTSLAMDVAGASADPGANILLWDYNQSNPSANQRWIFVPVDAFTESGTYKICLYADKSKRVDIEGAAQKSLAQALVWTAQDVDNQIFATEIDEQSGCVRFVAAHSGLCLDIAAASASNSAPVVQWARKAMTDSDVSKQFWLPYRLGSVKYNDQEYDTYEIRSQSNQDYVMDCLGGTVQNMTKIGVWPKNGADNQKFFFMKTERNLNDIDMPGPIDQTQFERTGTGSVTVSGLTFASSREHFQARYRVVKFKANRTEETEVRGWTSVKKWKDVITPEEEPDAEQRAKKTEILRYSTAREGWGDAWSATFDATPSGGIISMPFEETYELDGTWQSMEITFQIRAYEDKYADTRAGNVDQIYYKAHGPIRSSTIKIIQKPTVKISQTKGMKLFVDNSKNAIGITTTLVDSLGNGCERLRARIVDADGEPITEWVSDSSMTINHVANETLRRLPVAGETVYCEYSMLTPDGASVEGRLQYAFSYGSSTIPDFTPSIEYLDDDSCCAIVSSPAHEYDYCLMAVPDTDGTTLIHCSSAKSDDASVKKWKIVPPINTNVSIIIMGSSDLLSWKFSTVDCRVDSHLFIWNWTESVSSDPYDGYASIIINTDAPPQQTRKYTTSINFNSPSGRLNPVAFSDINMSTDLSIEGVALDDGVDYVGPSELPKHTSIRYIKSLIRLSGKGIHPIYRTPYGDWNYVGIESIDITKKEMYLCSAAITQRAVED